MTSPFTRRPRPAVGPGERVLASATAGSGEVGGTRDALYLPEAGRLPWEEIAAADWDPDERTLTVTETGRFGEERAVHVLHLDDAGRLLQLVRERVTASIALQRHVPVAERRSVRILARQAPGRRGELAWFVEYDAGLDPADPAVDAVVQAALAAARADIGA
ncbi:MAG TPA: hypothetical protein VNS46_03345 [Nocardioides sp.]|nr:hypothetical protein [Nocardioides sp.]